MRDTCANCQVQFSFFLRVCFTVNSKDNFRSIGSNLSVSKIKNLKKLRFSKSNHLNQNVKTLNRQTVNYSIKSTKTYNSLRKLCGPALDIDLFNDSVNTFWNEFLYKMQNFIYFWGHAMDVIKSSH